MHMMMVIEEEDLLPDPLPAGTPMLDLPGGTKIWRPDWNVGKTIGQINPDFLATAVSVAKEAEMVSYVVMFIALHSPRCLERPDEGAKWSKAN